MRKQRVISFILTLAMVLSLIPAFAVSAYGTQPAVDYRSPVYNTDGDPSSGIKQWDDLSCDTYTVIASGSAISTLSAGWYVVDETVVIDNAISASGAVNLILKDGSNLTVNGGIRVTGTNSLTIYGSEYGNSDAGVLNAKGKNKTTGIGGGDWGGRWQCYN